jgi:hypothetical protein
VIQYDEEEESHLWGPFAIPLVVCNLHYYSDEMPARLHEPNQIPTETNQSPTEPEVMFVYSLPFSKI